MIIIGLTAAVTLLWFLIYLSYIVYKDEKFLKEIRQSSMDSLIERKTIELYILIDSDSRICYTGSYIDLKSKQTNELKLIKLEGVTK